MYNLLQYETTKPNTKYSMPLASPFPSYELNDRLIREIRDSLSGVSQVSRDTTPFKIGLLHSEDKSRSK